MTLFDKEEYTLEDIQWLIDNEIEEDIHLDYKDGRAISKEDKKRIEITKDISAFANSDGGVIIYGLTEKDHKPQDLAPVDGNIFTKEWIEQVAFRINRRISDLKIYPIRIEGDVSKSLYVVKIPRSNRSPHMAEDKRYYKRFNFSSVPMEEYEVRDSFNRAEIPFLNIEGCSISRNGEEEDKSNFIFAASIRNDGNVVAEYYKLVAYFYTAEMLDFVVNPIFDKPKVSVLRKNQWKVSLPSSEYLYPEEVLSTGYFTIAVDKSSEHSFYDNLMIELVLYYKGSTQRTLYIPSENKYIDDIIDIDSTIKRYLSKMGEKEET